MRGAIFTLRLAMAHGLMVGKFPPNIAGFSVLPRELNPMKSRSKEEIQSALDRLDFEMFCAMNSDNAYFTSGHQKRDELRFRALKKELDECS